MAPDVPVAWVDLAAPVAWVPADSREPGDVPAAWVAGEPPRPRDSIRSWASQAIRDSPPRGGAGFSGAASARGLSGFEGDGAAGLGRGAANANVWHGPNGATIAHGSAGERGIAAGPHGVVGGSREASATAIRGPGGNEVARGQASSRGFYGDARGTGTWRCSTADMHVHGNYVRTNFDHWGAFDRGWYARYPGAWVGRGLAAGVWTAATWADINAWYGTEWPAMSYDYGDNLYYDDGNVYLAGQEVATAAAYYQSAAELAQTGAQANVDDSSASADNPQWLPLGVFEAVPPGEKSSKMTFQLAVNKAGILRGNYYNTGDNNVQKITGAVDKQTQRVTWEVADRQDYIFDTGLSNLTKDESTMLVHQGPDKTQQWTLVRLQQSAGGAASNTTSGSGTGNN